jgi:hypothetical protein
MLIISENTTKQADLEQNQGTSCYLNYGAQQNSNVFQIFYDFFKEVNPSRILEIGTGYGGLTIFLGIASDDLGLTTNIRTYDPTDYGVIFENKNIDARRDNIFPGHWQYLEDREVIDYIQQDGITIIMCDGSFKKAEFPCLAQYLKVGDFIMAHDYAENQAKFDEMIYKKVWNWMEITRADVQESMTKYNLAKYKPEIFEDRAAWICTIKIQ